MERDGYNDLAALPMARHPPVWRRWGAKRSIETAAHGAAVSD